MACHIWPRYGNPYMGHIWLSNEGTYCSVIVYFSHFLKILYIFQGLVIYTWKPNGQPWHRPKGVRKGNLQLPFTLGDRPINPSLWVDMTPDVAVWRLFFDRCCRAWKGVDVMCEFGGLKQISHLQLFNR